MLGFGAFGDTLTWQEIIVRIILAIILSGIIGYERGRNRTRPAGFRTHILVCLGATSVSLLEDQLRVELLHFVMLHPYVGDILKTDLTRLGAQVITGIGFLGAGTIMRYKVTVGGLTTAASLWATGCLGLIIGWGFYPLAISVGIGIIVVLVVLKRFEDVVLPLHHRGVTQNGKPYNSLRLDISFNKDLPFATCVEEIYTLFDELEIRVKEFNSNPLENKAYYRLHFDKNLNSLKVLKQLSLAKGVTSFHCY